MWFLFKIVVVAVAFLIRWFYKSFGKHLIGFPETINQKTLYVRKVSNKHNIVLTVFRFEYKSLSLFKLSGESEIDLYFKKLGFANEVQTGDIDFDQKIYVASDSSLFRNQLIAEPQLRKMVLNLFNLGCESIEGNGQFISFSFSNDKSKDQNLKEQADLFFSELSMINKSSKAKLNDTFSYKVLLAESIIWSVAAYSWTSYFGWAFGTGELHLNPFLLVVCGLILGMALLVFMVFLVAKFFKGSSRGHRIFIESIFVLGLSVPIAGISLFHDINTFYDNNLPVVIEVKVISLEEKIHRSRSNKTSKSYHLEIQNNPKLDPYKLKTKWKISSDQYNSIGSNQNVQFKIKPGRLFLPWIQSIDAAVN